MKNYKTLVVNQSYLPISIIDARRAFVIWYKYHDLPDEEFKHKGVTALYSYNDTFTSAGGNHWAIPSVIRVPTNYRMDINKVTLSSRNVFQRDDYQCVYCGSSSDLTLDHVIPRSKGGKDTWENLVTACSPCNSEKSDLDVAEWSKDIPKPYRPHSLLLINKNIGIDIPETWKQFLFL